MSNLLALVLGPLHLVGKRSLEAVVLGEHRHIIDVPVLAPSHDAEVQAVYDTYSTYSGVGPNGDFLWMEPPEGSLKVADAETPSDWKTVAASVPGEEGELASMKFARTYPVSSDGEWAHFNARYLPSSEEGTTGFTGIYRFEIGASLGSPELLFDPRDYNYTKISDWLYYPSSDVIVTTAVEDRGSGKTGPFVMPAEPGAEKTEVGSISLDQAPYRDFMYGRMAPDGSKLGLYFVESDTEFGRYRDGTVVIRFVDPSQPENELGSVELSYGRAQETVWSADGTEVVVSVAPWDSDSSEGSPKIWHIDTEGYQKTDLTGQVPVSGIGSGVIQKFGPEGPASPRSWRFRPKIDCVAAVFQTHRADTFFICPDPMGRSIHEETLTFR